MPTMVFHLPWIPDLNGNRAPLIRPARMINAFKNIGWDVIEVTGLRNERKTEMAQVCQAIRNGRKIDFCYSECATIPTTIIEPAHWPPVPFLDHKFLGFLHRNQIPIGLFYRDVYWQLDDYKRQVKWPLRPAMKLMFRWDLWNYRRYLKCLYLPTREMGQMLPIFPQNRISTLPPGGIIPTKPKEDAPERTLRLMYVGALGHYYRIDTMIAALAKVPQAQLTVVTHADQWEAYVREIPLPIPPNVNFTTATGEKLAEIYASTDIAMLFMEPNQFRELTLPVKLFEAIGWGCPMIAGDSSMAGKFITEHGAGWVLPVKESALVELLNELLEHPEELAKTQAKLLELRQSQTWEARACQVVGDLTGGAEPGVEDS